MQVEILQRIQPKLKETMVELLMSPIKYNELKNVISEMLKQNPLAKWNHYKVA